MANNISLVLVSRALKLILNNGTDVNGNARTVSRNFTNINPSATAEQLKTAADALVGLMDNTVASVYDVQRSLLQETEAEEG